MRADSISTPSIALPSRYDMLFRLASGGTASVHLGRLKGFAGFWRLVAVKVAHAHLAVDPLFYEMMVDEARYASMIHHPNVVPVIDIEEVNRRLLLVMEYIEGASLSELIGATTRIPARIALRIALDACAGLHAAHTLTDAAGNNVGLVHRDVSPQNILVGTDGVSRITDFGIAKTNADRAKCAGDLKGKLAYVAPEYILGSPASPASDVFGLAVVLWEMLAGHRLFSGETSQETLWNVLYIEAPRVSETAPDLGVALDAVMARALVKDPEERYASAKAFGTALENAARRGDLIADADEVSDFLARGVGDRLAERRRRIGAILAEEQVAHEQPSGLSPAARAEITARAVPRPQTSAPAEAILDASPAPSENHELTPPTLGPLGPLVFAEEPTQSSRQAQPPPAQTPSQPPAVCYEVSVRGRPTSRPPAVRVQGEPAPIEEGEQTLDSNRPAAPASASREPSPRAKPSAWSKARGFHAVAIAAFAAGALARALLFPSDNEKSDAHGAADRAAPPVAMIAGR